MKNATLHIKSFRKYFLLVFTGLLFTCGCAGCLKTPVVTGVDGVEIGTATDSSLQMLIRLKVFNPNGMNAKISAAHLQLYYKGRQISTSELDSAAVLNGKATSIVPLRTRMGLSNLMPLFSDLLKSDSITFHAEGTCSTGLLGVNMKIPVKQDIRLNVHELIKGQVAAMFQSDSSFQVRSIHMAKLPGLQTTGFNVVVRWKNGFRFDYKLLNIDLRIYRKGGRRPLADWKAADTIKATAGGFTDVPFNVAVNNVAMLSETRFTDLLHTSMDVTIKGTATVAINKYVFTIPVEQDKHISLAL